MDSPKALLPVHGTPMLLCVFAALREAVETVVVVAAEGQELPPLPDGVLLTHDPVPDGGPLVGFAAGWATLPPIVTAAFVSSCDAPLLHPAFVTHLLASLGDATAAVPRDADGLHPLAAAYRRAAADTAASLLAAGRRSMHGLLDALPAVAIVEDFPHAESLRNVNTPGEYAELLGERPA